MSINHLLHLVITTQKDPTPVVDMLGPDLQHARHPAVDGLAAGVLKDHGHRLDDPVSLGCAFFFFFGFEQVEERGRGEDG